MTLGPVEYIIVGFPGNQFNGKIIPAVADLVDHGLVRILDLSFITKESDGTVVEFEFEFEDIPEHGSSLAALDGEAGQLLSDADVNAIGADLEPESSAVLRYGKTCGPPRSPPRCARAAASSSAGAASPAS